MHINIFQLTDTSRKWTKEKPSKGGEGNGRVADYCKRNIHIMKIPKSPLCSPEMKNILKHIYSSSTVPNKYLIPGEVLTYSDFHVYVLAPCGKLSVSR